MTPNTVPVATAAIASPPVTKAAVLPFDAAGGGGAGEVAGVAGAGGAGAEEGASAGGGGGGDSAGCARPVPSTIAHAASVRSAASGRKRRFGVFTDGRSPIDRKCTPRARRGSPLARRAVRDSSERGPRC